MNKEHILVAHSDGKYSQHLRMSLKKNGVKVSKKITNAFEALGYLIKYRPHLAILEFDFSYLTAQDIMKLVRRKHIDTQFIIIIPERYEGTLPEEPYFYKNDSIDFIEAFVLDKSESEK